MNGAPLPPDHGAPVRLVVPGYYGCCCIKWINRIDLVPSDAPTTTQMREFSARTGQRGIPDLARDYEPPAIDLAAMPVRVEQWLLNEQVVYRVMGIRWGGQARRVPLTIRFRHNEPYVPVDDCPDAISTTTWSLWSHRWRPTSTGRYQIVLGVQDRSLRTRRLDDYYYTREVDIDRV
jgi:DMSO/TMAO reductase YedYZ molybdopterin-dependent catalytic subunit